MQYYCIIARMNCEEKLKQHGYRLTKPRKLVVKALKGTKVPLNAYQIQEKIQKEGDSIDVVTVYRILEVFEDLKMIHRHSKGGFLPCKTPDCEDEDHCHHQFTCDKCHEVTEIHVEDDAFIERLNNKFKSINIQSHHFEFEGICAKCKV